MASKPKELTPAQKLEAQNAELIALRSASEDESTEMDALKADLASLTESVATLSTSFSEFKSAYDEANSAEDAGDEDEGDEEGEEAPPAEDEPPAEEDAEAEDAVEDEDAKALLILASTAISGLSADNVALKSLEQNVSKRASALLAAQMAELGISPAMKTDAPASGAGGDKATVTRAEFDALPAQQKNEHIRAGGKITE